MLRPRAYQKRAPQRDAKKIVLVCEGSVRERDYFAMFQGFDSRIQIELIVPSSTEDNSPTGLLNKAKHLFGRSETNPSSSVEIEPDDELWFIIDTDQWGEKITVLRAACQMEQGWHVAQSNPCFEVWLYYHFFPKPSTDVGYEIAENWKRLLNNEVAGGFDSKKHYLLIPTAIAHAAHAFEEADGRPAPGTTEVFKPAKAIYEITRDKIDRMLHQARV
jgi:hypothetical protein